MNNQDLVSNTIHASINAGRTIGLCEAMSALVKHTQLVCNSNTFTNEEKTLVCNILSIVGDEINDLRKNIESEVV